MKEWNRVNSYREFILYSCRNLKLLQKCNVVLNYAETFYKSNVNCTVFLYKNKSKTLFEHVSFWGWWGKKVSRHQNQCVKPSSQLRVQLVFYTTNMGSAVYVQENIWRTSKTKCPYQTCPMWPIKIPSRGQNDPEAHSCINEYLGRTDCTFTFSHAM